MTVKNQISYAYPRLALHALWWSVALGVLLRVVRYAANRSLWGDEGALALNILNRSYRELTEPLDFVQGAPTGFLLAERLATDLLGDRELTLRLVPLISGVVALVLFALLARRILSPWGAALATLLVAVSEPLVYFSSEVKQYGVDVAVTVALLWGAVVVDWRRVNLLRGAGIVLAGGLAVWLSHAAILVLPALAAVLLANERSCGRWPRALVTVTIAWAVTTLAAVVVNRSNANEVASAALASTGSSAGDGSGPLRGLWDAFSADLGIADKATALGVVTAAAGTLVLARKSARSASIVLAPLGIALLVGALGLYPFTDRFVLFLAPVLALLVAEGAVELVRSGGALGFTVGVVSIALLVAYPAGVGIDKLVRPPGHEEVKSVLRLVQREWRPGDALYVWWQSQYPFRYYAECRDCGVLDASGPAALVWPPDPSGLPDGFALASRPPDLRVAAKSHELASYVEGFAPLAGRKRAWFLFSSTWDDEFVRYTLDCMGRRLLEARDTRAVTYLYDLSRPSRDPGCPAGA